MHSKIKQIRIGTSGWYYEHWRKVFYPCEFSKDEWLEFFCRHFDTVELNNTFYHLPKKSSVEKWYMATPENFMFTVKASRFITHVKKLNDPQESLKKFIDIIEPLKEKLGPILYQLPPNLHADLNRLENFIAELPKKQKSFFEFRHTSWYDDKIFELLDRYGCGLCVHDLGELATSKVITGRMIYLRFHGQPESSDGNYLNTTLMQWAKWIHENVSSVHDVFAYFNNDAYGNAVKNAMTLKKMIGKMDLRLDAHID